jgi:hypothetical protein
VSMVADDALARLVAHPACAWFAEEVLFRPHVAAGAAEWARRGGGPRAGAALSS